MIEILKIFIHLPVWSLAGIVFGLLIAGISFVTGYKQIDESNPPALNSQLLQPEHKMESNIILIDKKYNPPSLDIKLKNVGDGEALIYEIVFMLKTSHITKGTCGYLPATEYTLTIDLNGSKKDISKNIKNIIFPVSQHINAGSFDRILLKFISKKASVYTLT